MTVAGESGGSETIGTARIDIIADTKQFETEVARAKSQIATLGPAGEASFAKLTASGKRATLTAMQLEQAAGKSNQAMKLLSLTARGALPESIDRLRAAYQGVALDSARFSDAQLLSANRALAAFKTQSDAARAAAASQAEISAADDARFRQIAANATAEVEARHAVTTATLEQARANAVLAESQGVSVGIGTARAVGVLDAATVRQQIADYAALDAIMGKKIATTAEVAAAEAALDRLQAAGAISNEELAETFAALDVVTAAETKALHANSAAQVENAAATRINSRTQYELGIMLGEVASGNINRLKRSGAALANSTGLLRSIMTPTGLAITGVVAALALFGKMIYDREEDLLAFNKALAATGDFAGTTGLQLQGFAAQVGQSTGDYKGATAAVLALAQSGTVLGSDMQQMATTAVNMAYLTGQSVDGVVKELIKLQGDPTQAISKATEAMGLLTTAQYNQIVETQQTQGVTAAAALAMKDLGSASDEARQKLVDNAGVVIRTWTNFKNVLGDIGRDIASIGATQSTGEQIAALQKQRNLAFGEAEGGGNPNPSKDSDVVRLDAQIAALRNQQRGEAMFAAGQELANQAKQAHDKALAEALASTKQGDEGFVAQADAINQKRYAALIGIVDPFIRDRINAVYDQQIRDAVKRANAQYGGGSGGSRGVRSPKDNTDRLRQMALDDFQKEIAAQGKLDDAQKRSAASDAAYNDQLQQGLATRKEQINLQIMSVGMGRQEYERQSELLQVYSEFDRKLAQLNKERDRGSISTDQYNTRLGELKQTEAETVNAVVGGYKRMDAAQADWRNGLLAGMNDLIEQGKNVAGMVQGAFSDAFNGMNDALANFVTTGKLNFADLAKSIIQDLVKIELQAAESQILSSILGGNTATSFDSNGTFFSFAKGGAFNSPSLSRYSGGVYDSPHLFKFASGGVFGEAGPEAIMPLSRGADGKLGVKAQGGGDVYVDVQVNGGDGNAKVSQQQSTDSSGNKFIKLIIDQAVGEVNKQIGRNGSTAQVLQQTFGLNRRGVPVGG